jgi:hypothetical protein
VVVQQPRVPEETPREHGLTIIIWVCDCPPHWLGAGLAKDSNGRRLTEHLCALLEGLIQEVPDEVFVIVGP